jgi:hypothetical protein
LISLLKFCYKKETWGYAKVILEKKDKKRRVEKNRQVSDITKTMGT